MKKGESKFILKRMEQQNLGTAVFVLCVFAIGIIASAGIYYFNENNSMTGFAITGNPVNNQQINMPETFGKTGEVIKKYNGLFVSNSEELFDDLQVTIRYADPKFFQIIESSGSNVIGKPFNIPPGESKSFVLYIKMPEKSGTYSITVDFKWEYNNIKYSMTAFYNYRLNVLGPSENPTKNGENTYFKDNLYFCSENKRQVLFANIFAKIGDLIYFPIENCPDGKECRDLPDSKVGCVAIIPGETGADSNCNNKIQITKNKDVPYSYEVKIQRGALFDESISILNSENSRVIYTLSQINEQDPLKIRDPKIIVIGPGGEGKVHLKYQPTSEGQKLFNYKKETLDSNGRIIGNPEYGKMGVNFIFYKDGEEPCSDGTSGSPGPAGETGTPGDSGTAVDPVLSKKCSADSECSVCYYCDREIGKCSLPLNNDKYYLTGGKVVKVLESGDCKKLTDAKGNIGECYSRKGLDGVDPVPIEPFHFDVGCKVGDEWNAMPSMIDSLKSTGKYYTTKLPIYCFCAGDVAYAFAYQGEVNGNGKDLICLKGVVAGTLKRPASLNLIKDNFESSVWWEPQTKTPSFDSLNKIPEGYVLTQGSPGPTGDSGTSEILSTYPLSSTDSSSSDECETCYSTTCRDSYGNIVSSVESKSISACDGSNPESNCYCNYFNDLYKRTDYVSTGETVPIVTIFADTSADTIATAGDESSSLALCDYSCNFISESVSGTSALTGKAIVDTSKNVDLYVYPENFNTGFSFVIHSDKAIEFSTSGDFSNKNTKFETSFINVNGKKEQRVVVKIDSAGFKRNMFGKVFFNYKGELEKNHFNILVHYRELDSDKCLVEKYPVAIGSQVLNRIRIINVFNAPATGILKKTGESSVDLNNDGKPEDEIKYNLPGKTLDIFFKINVAKYETIELNNFLSPANNPLKKLRACLRIILVDNKDITPTGPIVEIPGSNTPSTTLEDPATAPTTPSPGNDVPEPPVAGNPITPPASSATTTPCIPKPATQPATPPVTPPTTPPAVPPVTPPATPPKPAEQKVVKFKQVSDNNPPYPGRVMTSSQGYQSVAARLALEENALKELPKGLSFEEFSKKVNEIPKQLTTTFIFGTGTSWGETFIGSVDKGRMIDTFKENAQKFGFSQRELIILVGVLNKMLVDKYPAASQIIITTGPCNPIIETWINDGPITRHDSPSGFTTTFAQKKHRYLGKKSIIDPNEIAILKKFFANSLIYVESKFDAKGKPNPNVLLGPDKNPESVMKRLYRKYQAEVL